jgi:hypothetical protein
MNKTKKQLLIFTILCLLIGVVLQVYYTSERNRIVQAIESRISEGQNKPLIFFGTSYIALGIEDREYSLFNAAANSEPYIFTLEKIKLLKPSVAVIGFNPQNFQKNYETAFDEGLLNIPQYAYLFERLPKNQTNQIKSLMDFESWNFYKAQKIFPFMATRMAANREELLFGGWDNKEALTHLDSFHITKRLKEEFYRDGARQSEFQRMYLYALLEYCIQEGIQVVLLATPAVKTFREGIPSQVLKDYEQTQERILAAYPVHFYDYFQQEYPAAYFFDADHLNGIGAQDFTRRVVQRLREDGVLHLRPEVPMHSYFFSK